MKARSPRCNTEFGTVMLVIEVQSWKAESLMVVNLLFAADRNTNETRFVHPLNAAWPMLVTLGGIEIEVIAPQFSKARSGITGTKSGTTTTVSPHDGIH